MLVRCTRLLSERGFVASEGSIPLLSANRKDKMKTLKEVFESNEKINIGYYWIIINGQKTIGYYEGEYHNDGSINTLPWQCVGSDEIFNNKQVKVIRPVQ